MGAAARASNFRMDFGPEAVDFKMLRRCHEVWDRLRYIKQYQLNRAAWIPGHSGQCSSGGKARSAITRATNFAAALDSPFNFFFFYDDNNDSYVRAPFPRISDVLELPCGQYGAPLNWLPFRELGTPDNDEMQIQGWDEDDVRAAGDAYEVAQITRVDEIGHVPSLLTYQGLDIDRSPELLSQWIETLQSGVDLGDGWFQASVPSAPAHGIPGRAIPRTTASLATVTREARSVSVRGRCRNADFKGSHFYSVAIMLTEMEISCKNTQ
jgi:hypothetical protein